MNVYLVRHASAGLSNHLDPNDIQRPLDTQGQIQANLITDILLDAEIGRMLSSPALRCLQTLKPLSEKLELELEEEPALVEGTDIERSWALLETTAHNSDGADIVMCSHGDIIPELVSRARGRGMSIPGRSGFSKGSIWTLTFDGESFITGKYRSVKVAETI